LAQNLPTPAFYCGIPTWMDGPTCIFWANLGVLKHLPRCRKSRRGSVARRSPG
jgi:hypothetical protein